MNKRDLINKLPNKKSSKAKSQKHNENMNISSNNNSKQKIKQKTRFDGLDVAAMVHHIHQNYLGYKVANIYDASHFLIESNKATFIIKLINTSSLTTTPVFITKDITKEDEEEKTPSQQDENQVDKRCMLLLESGVRFHTTSYISSGTSDTTSMNHSPPSSFSMKLRKHLRNLRLENILQLGNYDRVVDLRFGSGHTCCHIILELYGLGNIILTDSEYRILALLRKHEYNESDVQNYGDNEVLDNNIQNDFKDNGTVKVRVGNVYPVTYATTITQTISSSEIKSSLMTMNREEAYQWAQRELILLNSTKDQDLPKEKKAANSNKNGHKNRRNNDSVAKTGDTTSMNLKSLLLKPSSGVFHYGPSLIEHCILSANLQPSLKFTSENIEQVMPPSSWETLLSSLIDIGPKVLKELNNANAGGYILYRNKISATISTTTSKQKDSEQQIPHSDKVFESFQPHPLFLQNENNPKLTYATFAAAVDDFFSLLDGQKRALRAEKAERDAEDKLRKIQLDQTKRMQVLENDIVHLQEKAGIIESHADDVDKAIGVINSAVATGMDWEALEELVEVEKGKNNPIALLIKKIQLEKDEIVLSLPDITQWNEADKIHGIPPPFVDIVVSLKESAHGNARKMYDQCRDFKEKANKTIEASEKALRAAESNALRQIEQAKKNTKYTYSTIMQPQRKIHWFEKFHWFVTSDNYLVLGGRDAQQNEILVKRYLRPGDAYIHADVHGAPTCVLRAKRRRTANGNSALVPLSNQALREAGNFAICRSSAWSSKMITSAWWVESDQVSKTAPTGEYLTVGSFMIRGKKNFLPATPLEMGLAVMFRLGDDVSIKRHINDRRDFALLALDDENEELVPEYGMKISKDSNPDANIEECKLSQSDVETSKVQGSENTEELDSNDSSSPVQNDSDAIDVTNKNLDSIARPKKKKGLSARDRKLIKRYGSLEAVEEVIPKFHLNDKEQIKEVDTQHTTELGNVVSKTSNIRGKRSKMKKIKKKYGDQDDEDRMLAMLALQGSSKHDDIKKDNKKYNSDLESSKQRKASMATTALLVKDPSEVANQLNIEVKTILSECVKPSKLSNADESYEKSESYRWDKLDAEVLEQLISLDSIDAQKACAERLLRLIGTSRVDNYSASLSGIIRTVKKYGHEQMELNNTNELIEENKKRKTKAEKEAEKEEWKKILAEDGIVDDIQDNIDTNVDDTAEIEKLTGKPLPEDLILYALPICAPYSTLSQYKFRLKLTPGSQKRGKASRQCVDMFCQSENLKENVSTLHLYDMIKGVNDNEWVQTICGDVKISAPGASKAAKNMKASHRKGASNK